MNHSHYFLKAIDEAALKQALPFLVDEQGQWIRASHYHALDVIGILMVAPATLGTDGVEQIPAQVADGFHANLSVCADWPYWVPPSICVTPSSPSRHFF